MDLFMLHDLKGKKSKKINNAEKKGKRQVLIKPVSKVVIKFLQIMQKKGYVGEFEFVDNHGAGKIILELNGRLNKCGCISPRYNIQLSDMESWNTRLLPSRQENFGAVVITTSAGIMDLTEASEKKIGGKILGYFY